MRAVTIVDTSVANIASMQVAFDRLGFKSELTSNASKIANDEFVVLPGVGSFEAGMKRLLETGIAISIVERVSKGQPTLAVCLGLQLLCDASEESPGVPGLGIVPVKVQRFGNGLKVPQLGWNMVQPASTLVEEQVYEGLEMVDEGYAYFANSYRITTAPEGWGHATTKYGTSFVSALWKDNVLACQFHPELSGSWGLNLLSRWAQGANHVNV